ncbi:MAG: transglycosylase SLT domain-containing protein [Oxalobacteraceae bacterium]|nr:transglycosylase SLT domain-containing protein [Oxalobacteraceae bacterium]
MKPIFNAVILATCLLSSAARADVYGYVDAQGDTHFSTEALDERYQLFIKGDGVFDSSQLTPAAPEPLRTPLFKVLTEHPNLKKFEDVLAAAAAEFKVDLALMKAMMAAESGFNPAAISPKGAIGLMQIMPATAERYGLVGDARKSIQQKLSDPTTNVRLAARYLRELSALFPNQQALVIASYNAGEGAVQKYRNTIPPYPETRNYVRLVTQFYQFYVPQVPALAVATGRIHLTIPGRSNMPAPLTLNAN